MALLNKFASSSVAVVICIMAFFMMLRPERGFDAFVRGAKDALKSLYSLLPTLVCVLVCVSMLRGSGILDKTSELIAPMMDKIGVPSDLVPFIMLRPFSGGASMGMLEDIFVRHTPDSFIGRCASVIMSSSDTVFYVIAVYFSVTRVKKYRHTIAVSLISMIFSIFVSMAVVRICF